MNVKANNSLTVANVNVAAQQEEMSAMNGELITRQIELKQYFEKMKKQEEALQKSEERYRLVIEDARAGTERKRSETKLKRLAYYDPLTGILLRTSFKDRIKASIAEAKRNGLKLAVLFLDIDNFKSVNDTYGHHIGDKLLKKLAGRLKSCIRDTDILFRMGGDEFALLMPGFSNISEVDEIAKRIINLLKLPLEISGHKLSNTISLGIAVYPNNGQNGKTLLKRADIAMYKAKESGKNNLQYYNSYMSREINMRIDLKRDLKNAIIREEFFICYQPLINARTNRTECMEALIRWKHPTKGVICPVEFIPIAEETRLIIPIGEWILKNACKQLKEWNEKGFTNCRLSVNVSMVQFQQPDFAEFVGGILSETGLPADYLELEITESMFVGLIHTVTRNLNLLKMYGVKISVDDFGTGYNSLKYIQKFAVNSLKIDRSFVCNIKNDVNKAIVNTIISLGREINAETIAEGVETKEQYEYLKMKGCDRIQGYYFSKPLLPDAVPEFLKLN